ncbi:DNA ligase D [Pedobacter sp. SYSU D00535]|uniref:DNA ligase D n=1 Tax=Pedobacter sp. SYSU D00535 TaxID=2810308 RepID=UPI001A96D700|nr:DNA ligase D [Pedobacter sp. SYSU D00535]
MGLKVYKEKRNFKETSEPEGNERDSSGKLRFVVQRHHASHLHYDLRLEMEGVLKSWAVPKGPSLNPKDKRLAMMVEDHPYDYRTFEGVIPEGNYGAGVVTIFDEGTYESLEGKDDEKELKKGLYSGNLKFKLHGKILNGEFALVKLKGSEDNSWLLIKHRDQFAVDAKFSAEDLVPEKIKKQGKDRKKLAKVAKKPLTPSPAADDNTPENTQAETGELDLESLKPMLAKLSSDVFDDPDWVYEKKLDGYRALAFTGDGVRLISRNGLDFTSKYAAVTEILAKIENQAVLDGELVAEDSSGRALFQEIQNYRASNKKIKLKYYVFDLLALNGHDVRSLELVKRKELLKALIARLKSDTVVYNEHVFGEGKKLFEEAEKNKWEGIIAKSATSRYESDRRSDKWLKFKVVSSQEAIILGYSKPAGSRKYFGSLVLGLHEGKELKYIGNCGTGFTEQTLKDVFDHMTQRLASRKPVSEKVPGEKNITWIHPDLVCEVNFSEWTGDRHLRHPVFKGLRFDKTAGEVKQEGPVVTEEDSENMVQTETKQKDFPDETEESFGKKKLKLTNLNKLYWKKEGIKKGQLLEYYRDVSDYILPYLKDRPLSLNRHPNGIDAPNFFQKDLDTEKIPDWISYQTIYSESVNKEIDYLICNNLPTLLWMVNLGCIEINPWLSTCKKPDHPTFAVMDLDPNDVDDFTEVVRVALTTKEILDQMGVRAFIKTSGSRGLHIFIHLGGKYDYELVKNFVQYLGQLVLQQHPDTTSLERSPSKRKKKIYLDFLQNRKGQTIAAPYSARPKIGATVSTPLDWDEVNEELDIKQFTIFNTMDRLKEKGDLWQDITKEKTDLKAALKRLA